MSFALQVPPHDRSPLGQELPQLVPSHEAVPPLGAEQTVQPGPHEEMSFVTHAPAQTCLPLGHD